MHIELDVPIYQGLGSDRHADSELSIRENSRKFEPNSNTVLRPIGVRPLPSWGAVHVSKYKTLVILSGGPDQRDQTPT
ncbi:MAG: hypothetical protein AB7E72_02400 [Lysobacterales bacterium]